MSRCDIVHETIVRDIVDIVMDLKDSDEVDIMKNKRQGKSFKSIASASSNLILTFPVLVSKSATIETDIMVSKAIERDAAAMLQILFSAISVDNAENGMEFITKFHNNLKTGDLSVDKFIQTMDKIVSHESVSLDIDKYNAIKEDMKNLCFYLPNNINESKISDFTVYPKNIYGESVVDYTGPIHEDENIQNYTVRNSQNNKQLKDTMDAAKTASDIQRNRLFSSDVKKANELTPTMMVVNFISTKNDLKYPASIVIGVKAKMYPLDSQDIIDRLASKSKDKNGLLKFIKATTREISFFKDFLFAIDKAKLDALAQSKRGSSSKLWKILERRALKSKIRRGIGHINDATAISTLVITQEDVETLKKEYGIDVSKEKQIRPIMEAYNLMEFVIVDENMETASFLKDTGDDIYETLSFSNLEKEEGDKQYKKIVNLMTKVSR